MPGFPGTSTSFGACSLDYLSADLRVGYGAEYYAAALTGGRGRMAGGGGGGGYWGGGGGGNRHHTNNLWAGGGGGGGSGYAPSGTLVTGNGCNVANSGDPDYGSNAGAGGCLDGSIGQPGRVVITWN